MNVKIILIGALAAATVAVALPTLVRSAEPTVQNSPTPDQQTVNREHKGDRESLNFADRWEAVKELNKQNHPALHQWMVDHGVIGEGVPAVAKGE
jgi:hypothetical protein